jgi:uncharacterized short protein YbdD (DUF466 family)
MRVVDAGELRRLIDGAGRVLRAIIGAPDYERYLAHIEARHPDALPMSREEFGRQRLESRYSRPGSRCC